MNKSTTELLKMSNDIAQLIAKYSNRDNDKKVLLCDFIDDLTPYKISSKSIFLDSVLCKNIIDDIKTQFKCPIQLEYDDGDTLFSTNYNDMNVIEHLTLGDDIEFMRNKTVSIDLCWQYRLNYYDCWVETYMNRENIYFGVFKDKLDEVIEDILNHDGDYYVKIIRDLFDKTVLDFLEEYNVTVLVNGTNLMSDDYFEVERGSDS